MAANASVDESTWASCKNRGPWKLGCWLCPLGWFFSSSKSASVFSFISISPSVTPGTPKSREPMTEMADGVETAGTWRGGTETAVAAARVGGAGIEER